MSKRTIMIFPDFENMGIIDNIREKYDPLAQLVRPHITLIFPFENEMSNEKIEEILKKRLQDVKPFEIILNGVSKQEDRFGNTLLLNVKKGVDDICFIHDILYKNEFKQFDLGLEYKPHITIGKFQTAEELNTVYNDLKNLDEAFATIVKRISVEVIGKNEESIVVIEKML